MERGRHLPVIESIDLVKKRFFPSLRKRFNNPLRYARLSLAAGLGLALIACAPDSRAVSVITPEPTAQVAATPEPTLIPISPTPEPTSTPNPTATPEPIPIPDARLRELSLSCPT